MDWNGNLTELFLFTCFVYRALIWVPYSIAQSLEALEPIPVYPETLTREA